MIIEPKGLRAIDKGIALCLECVSGNHCPEGATALIYVVEVIEVIEEVEVLKVIKG